MRTNEHKECLVNARMNNEEERGTRARTKTEGRKEDGKKKINKK